MPVVCCQVAERLLDVGGDDPNDRRPTLRWLDIYATDNSHVHAPHRAWVQQVAHEIISTREINAKKANRRGSTNLKEEARGVAITAWLEEQAEKAKLMIAAEGAVVEAELLAKAKAKATTAEWVANTTEVAGISPTRVSYSLKRRSRAGWHDDKEAVLEVKATYLKAEAEATVQGKAALAAAAESVAGEKAFPGEPLQVNADLERTQAGDSFGLAVVSRTALTTATTTVISSAASTSDTERQRSDSAVQRTVAFNTKPLPSVGEERMRALTNPTLPPAEESQVEGRGRALTVTTEGVATAGGGTSAARILRSLQWREQAWREFAGSGAEDNDTGESGRGRDRSISGASAVEGGARRAIRARGGIRAGARRGSLSDGGDSDGEGGGGGGGKHTAQRASARHGSEVWSDDDAEEGVWEGGKLRSTTWHGPERRAFEARRKQLLARYEADAILLDTGVVGGTISGADDSSRGRFSNTEESGRGRDKSISGADDGGGGGLAGPDSLIRLLAPPPQRASRARRPSVTRHPELAAALSTREDSIAAQIPAWQHVDKRLPLLASASAIKLAPLRVKSAAARTKKTEPVPPSVGRSTWGRSHRDELPRSWKTKFQK